MTRDVHARLIVGDRDDRHCLPVGQWLTPVIIASSFLYVPFPLQEGMPFFYIDLTSAFVISLLMAAVGPVGGAGIGADRGAGGAVARASGGGDMRGGLRVEFRGILVT